jgi:hypothetical protein
VKFQNWISDAPDDAQIPNKLQVKGDISSYDVVAKLIQNVGGLWSNDSRTNVEKIVDGLEQSSHFI